MDKNKYQKIVASLHILILAITLIGSVLFYKTNFEKVVIGNLIVITYCGVQMLNIRILESMKDE